MPKSKLRCAVRSPDEFHHQSKPTRQLRHKIEAIGFIFANELTHIVRGDFDYS